MLPSYSGADLKGGLHVLCHFKLVSTPGPPQQCLGYPGPDSGTAGSFLQDQLAKSAVTALTSLYGTKYKYGSIIDTICKLLVAWKPALTGSSCRRCSDLGVAGGWVVPSPD